MEGRRRESEMGWGEGLYRRSVETDNGTDSASILTTTEAGRRDFFSASEAA